MPATTELLQKGRYRIEQPAVAEGSNGLFQAYDTVANTSVFVKEIVVRLNKVTTLSQQENMRLAFENKAKQMTEFRHDALLQVKDYYSDVGRQYLVLESVDGDDFQTLLNKNNGPFAVEDVLEWADQLLDGLNYLHNQKPSIVHKKVSPANIKLSPDGKVKLHGLSVTDESGNQLTTSLTEPSGTDAINYSPLELIWDSLDAASQKVIINSYDERSERILKEAPDARSDIYSLGATLYYLLTATLPVDPLERSIELLEGNPDPLKAPNTIDSRIAPEVSEVVMRALEIKRESRFDSAVIMRQVLRTALVRVKEREAAEAAELEEAAEVLRKTQPLKSIPAKAEPVAAPQPTEAEILAQKLREAEELRLQAERRAAEAERLLREKESAQAQPPVAESVSETVAPTATDDDLLGLIDGNATVHVSESPATPTIHVSVKPQADMPAAPKAVSSPPPRQATAEPVKAEVPQVDEEPMAANPAEDDSESYLLEEEPFEETAAASEPADDQHASVDNGFEPTTDVSRSGLPIPMIAAAAAALLIVAIGGWMFLGGSSAPVQQEAAPAPVQNAVAPPASETQQAPAETSDSPDATSPDPQPTEEQAIETQTEEPADSVKPAAKPAQKPAKPAADPAKTPAAKKPVTVDDLINDN